MINANIELTLEKSATDALRQLQKLEVPSDAITPLDANMAKAVHPPQIQTSAYAFGDDSAPAIHRMNRRPTIPFVSTSHMQVRRHLVGSRWIGVDDGQATTKPSHKPETGRCWARRQELRMHDASSRFFLNTFFHALGL
ncbi:uncharacterized protein PITG_09322 [Phytophthora infestans T30-4]|uniref:Uncharacterized protein n=1 Tax=Phytophthora infestans (strain T30-4) TaxID=403677 RepID=D0NBF2_PHYIT|nr:uncharacterized protein PITG_09322 [Phytophthora infestans T30-4]EEY55381.1 hypothetical protein PITG_09322 [Phytophthora infestans T30-4]|eukprot:XP_002903605.1 hypothetical protein PITG_09322 [Phytophthora infestans T30-4]